MIINRLEEEQDLNEWLNSIEFVGENGKIIPHILEEDNSDDPEGDRE